MKEKHSVSLNSSIGALITQTNNPFGDSAKTINSDYLLGTGNKAESKSEFLEENAISHSVGFSSSILSALGARGFFAVGTVLCIVGLLCCILGPHPLEASRTAIPRCDK